MKFPVVFQNALPTRDFTSLNNHLNWEGWLRTNTDDDPLTGVSWTHHDLYHPLFFKTASTLELRLKKIIREELSVVKIHVNGQTMGQLSSFHRDSVWDDVWTVVLFTNMEWNVNHGGEFTAFNPEIGDYQSISYRPNSAVAFPSNWEHRGACPLVPHAGIRTSLAVTYCLQRDLDEFMECHKTLRRFKTA